MTALPAYLRGISRVVVDAGVASAPLTERVRQRLGHLPWTVLPEEQPMTLGTDREDILYLKQYKALFAVLPRPAITAAAATGSFTSGKIAPCAVPIVFCRRIFRTGCSRSGPIRMIYGRSWIRLLRPSPTAGIG